MFTFNFIIKYEQKTISYQGTQVKAPQHARPTWQNYHQPKLIGTTSRHQELFINPLMHPGTCQLIMEKPHFLGWQPYLWQNSSKIKHQKKEQRRITWASRRFKVSARKNRWKLLRLEKITKNYFSQEVKLVCELLPNQKIWASIFRT